MKCGKCNREILERLKLDKGCIWCNEEYHKENKNGK